jgi:hypothetical protein
MNRQGHLRDRSRTLHRTYSDPGRAGDWGNAVVVALVLGAVVVMAAIAITVYDDSALLASRRSTLTSKSEPPTTGHADGIPETNGTAR